MTSYFFIKILVPRVKIPVKFWEALDSYHLPRAGLHPLSLSSVLPRLPKDHASTIQRGVDQNSTLLTQNNVLCSGFLVSGKRKGKKSVSSCKLNVKYCGYLCMCFRWWLWGLWYSSGFQKVLEGERLRKNSSSRVSCTSLLKSFKASFLEWRDWLFCLLTTVLNCSSEMLIHWAGPWTVAGVCAIKPESGIVLDGSLDGETTRLIMNRNG